MRMTAEDAFQALLEGRVRRAPARLSSLGALASALEPSSRPEPDPRFRRRLRNELLAAASVSDEELFAAALEGELVDARVGGLVTVAAALGSPETPVTQPDPRFRFALRNRLIDLGAAVPARSAGRRRRFSRSLVAVGAAATMLFGATVAAAQDSLPGDLVYSVKLAQERVSLWTVSGTGEGVRKLDFSRRRLGEVRGLTERGDDRRPLYTATLNRMDELTIDATDLILDGFAADRSGARPAVERLSAFASAQASDLASLLERLPPEVRPAARDSLGVVESTQSKAEAALEGCGACPDDTQGAPDTGSADVPTDPQASAPCQTCGSAGETTDPEMSGGSDDAGGSDGGDGDDPRAPDPVEPPVEDEPAVDVPPVSGTDADEQVEEQIDDLLDELGVEPPETTLPPAPVDGPAIPPPTVPQGLPQTPATGLSHSVPLR